MLLTTELLEAAVDKKPDGGIVDEAPMEEAFVGLAAESALLWDGVIVLVEEGESAEVLL